MYGLLILLVLLYVLFSDIDYNDKILYSTILFYIFITNYNMIKTYVIKPMQKENEIDEMICEKAKNDEKIIEDKVNSKKEDPRKRMKIKDMTIMDNHSFVNYEETPEIDRTSEVLRKIEIKDAVSANKGSNASSNQAGLNQAGSYTDMKRLEAMVSETLRYRKGDTREVDIRLMERSKVQGSRDLQSNDIRRNLNRKNKDIYKKFYETELLREENKIWWENNSKF